MRKHLLPCGAKSAGRQWRLRKKLCWAGLARDMVWSEGGQCVCHPPPLTPTCPSHDKPNHITALQKPWEEGKTTERAGAKDRMTSLKGRLWAGQVMFGENMSVHQSSRKPSLEPHSTAHHTQHSTAHHTTHSTAHTAQQAHTAHTTHTAGSPRSVAMWRAGGAAREGSHCLASLSAPDVVIPKAGPREFSYLGYTQKHFYLQKSD